MPISNPSAECPRAATGKFRFSTSDLPKPDRLANIREQVGREVYRMEIEPLPGHEYEAEWSGRMLPGLGFVSVRHSPVCIGRTRQLVTDGNDDVVFAISAVPCHARQRGQEAIANPGDGLLVSNSDIGKTTQKSASHEFWLTLPRSAFNKMLHEEDSCLMRPVPANAPALRLLKRYLPILVDEELATPELQHLVVSHVYDLLAVVFSARREVREIAQGRGIRAARLHAIKQDVLENLDEEISESAVAARHRLTARYVQKLFESEGCTFTEFVRGQRLLRAHDMLVSPRFRNMHISDIAFEAGFGDLSHFNRVFRHRFGLSPSDVRHRSLEDHPVPEL